MKILFRSEKKNWIAGSAAAGLVFLTAWLVGDQPVAGGVLALAALAANVLELRVENAFLRACMPMALAAATAVLSFVLAQTCMNILPDFQLIGRTGRMGYILNCLCALAFTALFYGLTLRINLSCLLTLLIALGLATVNYYVVQFRGSEMALADLMAAQPAANVLSSYQFTLTPAIGMAWLCAGVWVMILFCFVKYQRIESWLARVGGLCVLCACLLLISMNRDRIERTQWLDEGSRMNGFLLNFFANDFTIQKPEGYGDFDLTAVEEMYLSSDAGGRKPNVVVIMNEAFADLRLYNGSLNTNVPVMPFYDSLKENTIRGQTLVSIYGGGTSNSEYEFLTGNTLGFLPKGTNGYQQCIGEGSWSLAAFFRAQGYRTMAMHPHFPNGWMRSTVWPKMQFEEIYFRDDFPRVSIDRDPYVNDEELFQKILETLENKSGEAPVFMMTVTVQNHSDFNDPDYESTVALEGYSREYPEAEQYLSLLRTSDQALEKLIRGLEAVEEDTIVLFYGDHQARIEMEFFEELNGGPLESLEDQQKLYTVPFFIWANYDIAEEEVELTSLNYLGGYLLNAAGLPLPPYFRFLQDLEREIPAMNSQGYYSLSEQCFLTYEDAQEREEVL